MICLSCTLGVGWGEISCVTFHGCWAKQLSFFLSSLLLMFSSSTLNNYNKRAPIVRAAIVGDTDIDSAAACVTSLWKPLTSTHYTLIWKGGRGWGCWEHGPALSLLSLPAIPTPITHPTLTSRCHGNQSYRCGIGSDNSWRKVIFLKLSVFQFVSCPETVFNTDLVGSW